MELCRLERLLASDFSAGTEAFREQLLARCLAELASNEAMAPTAGNAPGYGNVTNNNPTALSAADETECLGASSFRSPRGRPAN